MQPVNPLTSIQQALRDTQEVSLHIQREASVHRVLRRDLEKMQAMGLDALPVESIAVPDSSPMLADNYEEITASFDLSRQLTSYLPVYFVAALYEMQLLLRRYNIHAYVIGGISRDMLLFQHRKMQVQDVDITVEGDAIALSDFLVENSHNFCVGESYPEFGTARIYYKDTLTLDLASTRRETYTHAGALPTVGERGVPLPEDIRRRDFTINALAFSVHDLGKILDYTHGMEDLENEEIRVLHPVSFFEDPSRILRALKFGARFDFLFATDTRILLERFFQYATPYYKGGGERIKQELKGFLGVDESDGKLRRLHFFLRHECYRLMNMDMAFRVDTPVLFERLNGVSAFLRRLAEEGGEETAACCSRETVFITYLCFILEGMPEEEFLETAKRLGLTRPEREAILKFRQMTAEAQLERLHEFSSPYEIYTLFHHAPTAAIIAAIIRRGILDATQFDFLMEAFQRFKRKWEPLRPELNGNDLIDLGVAPGKPVGEMMKQLLQAKLIGRLPEKIDEVRFVRELLETSGPEQPIGSESP